MEHTSLIYNHIFLLMEECPGDCTPGAAPETLLYRIIGSLRLEKTTEPISSKYFQHRQKTKDPMPEVTTMSWNKGAVKVFSPP